MAQIIGYLTFEEAAEFDRYASNLRLDRTALANLLIVRELRCDRLRLLSTIFDCKVSNGGKTKIVAHQSDGSTKAAFKCHVESHGLKPGRSAAILFRAELKEHWLLTSIDICKFDSV